MVGMRRVVYFFAGRGGHTSSSGVWWARRGVKERGTGPFPARGCGRPEDSQIFCGRIGGTGRGPRAYFERNRQFLKEICPLEDSLTEDPIQVMYTGPVAEMRRLVATLRSLPFSGDFSLAVAEYEARDFTIVDVIEHSCSKGSALSQWAAHLGIPREEILAIGDNLNDREMLDFAGLAVVMGNASPGLKSLGWPVTLSNDEGGVAAAIEQYVLADRHP